MNNKFAFILIATGATLWGIIGIFVAFLYEAGFTTTQVVAVRVLSASIFLVLYVFFKNRQLFKIKCSDSKFFIGTGVISIVFFNWCLFRAIEETSISVATILLYTAPAFVTIFSRFIFKELLTVRKVVALVTTLMGCTFVIGILPKIDVSITLFGFIVGLGSGFFYALYSIFGKFALKKYDSLTVTVYTFLFATVAIIPFSKLWTIIPLLTSLKVWIFIIGLGFFSTMLPYIFYTKGLNYVETSKASIIATIEPVIAALVGFFIFAEKLNVWQYLGIVLVITAVMIVQETAKTKVTQNNITQVSNL